MLRIRNLLLTLLFALTTLQASAFVVKSIRFEGLNHIAAETARSYVPVKIGEDVTPAISNEIIQKLFKTGFFETVNLYQEGNTLIIKVVERPVISSITLSGNKVIKSAELLDVLRKMNIAEGYEYNRATLNLIRSALLAQYYSHGQYNARVTVSTQKQPGNRVALSIAISEGNIAKIKNIHIVGNHAFTEKSLLSQFQLTTPGLFSWFTHDDEYSGEKLSADLEALQNFYYNRGYLKMHVTSSQVSLSPDRKDVYIDITIEEGPQYHFSGYNLKGNLILPRKTLDKLVDIKPGDIYSRERIIHAEKSIGYAVGDKGYARVQVTPDNIVDEKNHTVYVTFTVKPGRRIYVRRISFSGIDHTNDTAFRRALTQMEGELATNTRLENSKRNLQMMPFVQNVEEKATPVPGSNDQEDVGYDMTTMPGGQVQAGVGYSDLNGFLVNASLSQSNFYGTGNQFSIMASRSQSTLNGTISYYNPYYTPWGVGRGFNAYASRFNANKQNIADYDTNNYGFGVNYSIPMSLHNSLQLGASLDYLYLLLNSSSPQLMRDFRSTHGAKYLQILFNGGWTFNNLDRSIFPTKGVYNNLSGTVSAPAMSRGLEYYTFDNVARWYQPIYRSFIFMARGEVGYGMGYGAYSEGLPFFKNFYAGGLGTVAGYEPNTLGPQDSSGNALGGNALVAGRLGLIVPNPFTKSLRAIAFVDGGNVFDTKASESVKALNPDRNGLRYSAGLEVDWLTPFTGILKFSYAVALNPAHGDSKNAFQFNIGTSF